METTSKKSRTYAAIAAAVAAALAIAGLEPQAGQSVSEYIVSLLASLF